MTAELRNLTAEQFQQLPRSRTVFFLPVGPMEDHGPHLPIGMDLSEAKALCEATAARLEREMPGWQGVILPEAPLGVETNTSQAAIRVRAHVVRDWLIDTCRSLKRAGFVHFVCFSGHAGPRQLTTIEEAGKALMRSRIWFPFFSGRETVSFISASSAALPKGLVRSSPFWPDPIEHGGKRDTSLALYLRVQSAEGYAKLPDNARPASFWTRAWNRWRGSTAGYWGKPASASASDGELAITSLVDELFPKMRAVWEGSNPNALFRSWYSVLPPNQSLFKIWLLAFFLIVLLWIWAAFLLRGLEI